jgi:hypothetical protein
MTDPIKAAIAILGLLLVLLFGAWLVGGRLGPRSGPTPQAEPQATATPAPTYRPTNPQVDSTVPAGAETAGAGTAGTGTVTFALG